MTDTLSDILTAVQAKLDMLEDADATFKADISAIEDSIPDGGTFTPEQQKNLDKLESAKRENLKAIGKMELSLAAATDSAGGIGHLIGQLKDITKALNDTTADIVGIGEAAQKVSDTSKGISDLIPRLLALLK